MAQTSTTPTKRLVLRAVLNDVSPIVARVIAVPDHLEIHDLHEVFLSLLGWTQDLGFIVRIRAHEFNSFRRKTHGTRLRDFAMRRQKKFRYICDMLDLWEWEIRVLDVELVESEEVDIVCLTGRGAAPPEHCGGPRGYRLMLKRQQAGPELTDPASISVGVKLLTDVYQDELGVDLQFLEDTMHEGWKSVEERLARSGPLTPTRFSLNETNERLKQLMQHRRWWR
ncbi:MAG TPA: hypothetical protein VN666_08165 [Nitrospira sp.]|nr:hypothetical protein [Nitrospira sp.]